jgi:hypothetical protein
VFLQVPLIEATTPYRMVKMDLKKIMALAMIVFLALPSLTMAARADPDDPDDGADLADAIARARLYLSKVRTSAENFALEYSENEMMQGYLNEIYDLLDQEGEEAPEILLETTGDVGDGYEDTIVIPMPDGFTLGDLDTISWSEKLVYGYPPHVDVILDMGEGNTDALVFEYAYNYESHAAETWPTYDALTGDWYQTFSDDGNGPSVITGTSNAWLSSGAPGPLTGAPTFYYHTLEEWKSSAHEGVSSATPVLRLEIEVDNWIAQTEAYVKDIEINGVTDDFEGGAEGFLDRASAYFVAGDINLAARNLAAARNILGRVKGLLNSMVKAHKMARIDRFIQQFEHRIERLEDKIIRLRGRFGGSEIGNMMASMGLAKGKIHQLGEDLSEDNLDDVIDELEITTESIDEDLEELDGDDILTIDRLEAKIRVLKASAERLSGRGYDTDAVVDDLENAEALLEEILSLPVEGGTDEAEGLLEDAEGFVSEANAKIRGIRKEHQNKGSKGKGKG